MRARLRWRRGALLSLGLAAASCRGGAAEAPEPDAAAWGPAPRATQADRATDDELEPSERPRVPGTIFRDEIERATAPGPAYLLRQLGPEPYRHQGHFVGWTITRLFPDDPVLCSPTCDLALGDVILGVNGNPLATPHQLSDALEALPTWTRLEVHSLRDGVRRQVTYPIVDAPG